MARHREARITRVKDGRAWRIGDDLEVAWIETGTEHGVAITSAIPPIFEAYATVVLPCGEDQQRPAYETRHEHAVITVLSERTEPQPWWLGYLDTGTDNVVFPDAPRVKLYADWGYVLIEAGPDQAAAWRRQSPSFKGALPDLMFPADRSWLLSTLWDDEWSCIGGSAALIDSLMLHPELKRRIRRIDRSEPDATPPGHVAY
jgi:hypothetical protein